MTKKYSNKKSSNQPIKTLYEKTDPDIVSRLLSSDKLNDEEKNILRRYYQKISNGYVAVNYFHSKDSPDSGRLYAEGSVSLQNFKKGIRHALARNFYDDIDVVNAHPVLLAQYCDENNIRCDLLTDYINNREEWLNKIMKKHCVCRDIAKSLIIKLMYLGNYEIHFDSDKYRRCCVCFCIDESKDVSGNNVCKTCLGKAKFQVGQCEYGSDIKYVESALLDLHLETCPKADIDCLDDLTELIEFCCDEKKNIKCSKVTRLAKELRLIADTVYKLEKGLSSIVEKNHNKSNKKSSVLSMMLQDLEHKCLMSICNFFELNHFKVGVYVFDGVMIEKSKKKTITQSVLDKCSAFVKKETGYSISLISKPMDQGFHVPEFSPYVTSDREVQQKLFKLENPEYFHFCDNELYIFNEKTGMFQTDIESLDFYLMKHEQYFMKENTNDDDVSCKSYGNDAVLMAKVPKFVKVAARDDDWEARTSASSLGYLLFKDGIYNSKTNTFTKGFDPSIVFHYRVPHNFPERNESDIKYVTDMSFNLMFKDPLALIVAFGRAIVGDISAKKFFFCPGLTNAGKSKLVNMFITCFGNYIQNFNAECLAYGGKNDSRDAAARHRWIYCIRYSRIAFSNEVNMKATLNGNDIKKVSSGGDKIIGRTHYKAETSFVPHFTPFCMLNDIPSIDPMDDAVIGRLVYCDFKKQFVEKVTEDFHVKIDPKLDEKVAEPRFIRGFIHLILDGFQYFLKHGQPEFDQKIKEEWTAGDKTSSNVSDRLKKFFENGDTKSFYSVADMRDFKAKHMQKFLSVSDNKFNGFVDKTFNLTRSRIGANNVTGWKGLKLIWNDF